MVMIDFPNKNTMILCKYEFGAKYHEFLQFLLQLGKNTMNDLFPTNWSSPYKLQEKKLTKVIKHPFEKNTFPPPKKVECQSDREEAPGEVSWKSRPLPLRWKFLVKKKSWENILAALAPQKSP